MLESTRGRGRRTGRRLVLRVAAALAVLVAPATFPVASASFSGPTTTNGSTVAAADLAPPTNLAVAQTCAPGPGIAFRSVATATGTDSVTVPRPAGVVADDLLIAQVAHRNAPRTVTAPSGWTLLAQDQYVEAGVTSNAAGSSVFWKKAGAAEPATATFSLSAGTSVPVVGIVAAYSGVHRTSPLGVSNAAGAYGSVASAPSVTTTVAGARVVRFLVKRQETLPTPAGTTGRWALPSATSGNAWVGVTGSDEVRAVAGATSARTSSSSSFESEWVARTLELRPAPGPPSAALSWTASTTPDATGYQLDRVAAGTVQDTTTVTPVSTTSMSSGPLVDGTAYTFRLRTYHGTWTSPDATVGFTPAC